MEIRRSPLSSDESVVGAVCSLSPRGANANAGREATIDERAGNGAGGNDGRAMAMDLSLFSVCVMGPSPKRG